MTTRASSYALADLLASILSPPRERRTVPTERVDKTSSCLKSGIEPVTLTPLDSVASGSLSVEADQ